MVINTIIFVFLSIVEIIIVFILEKDLKFFNLIKKETKNNKTLKNTFDAVEDRNPIIIKVFKFLSNFIMLKNNKKISIFAFVEYIIETILMSLNIIIVVITTTTGHDIFSSMLKIFYIVHFVILTLNLSLFSMVGELDKYDSIKSLSIVLQIYQTKTDDEKREDN